ncbi:MAG: polysaccharide deacetylase family protein [Oscillibacter sp.]|jgi:polysaccharide deacetylase family sporulation protein PdaB|nr:polysaccharide deacetylase family protein [Oscillibacter sp.]
MKILIWKHRSVSLAALVMAIAMVGYIVAYPSFAGAYAADRPLPIYCVDRGEEKVCAISFDAAWGNEDTETLIKILDQYHVKATFFVVGDWVDKYPESVKALADAGHEVMSHSNHHDHYNSLTSEQIIADLKTSCDKIEKVTGVRPTLIRCPYGEYDNHVIEAIRSIGVEPIQWNIDSLDWKELPASEITQRVTSRIEPGSIILFHNAAKHTPEALPAILEKLIGQGYQIVPISKLLLPGTCDQDFTMDHTGKQLKCS